MKSVCGGYGITKGCKSDVYAVQGRRVRARHGWKQPILVIFGHTILWKPRLPVVHLLRCSQ
jgi:hypothetical protein